MRRKRDTQGWIDFQPSNLNLTNEYFAKYEAISGHLDATPEILDLVHRDTKDVLSAVNGSGGRRRGHFKYTSEHVLRICICQVIEAQSLRGITIRIDDSSYLRRFTRLYEGPMMDFTTFDRLRNAIRPTTWKRINQSLARAAVEQALISGEQLRLDTTVVETNIHFPTDSSLLWDSYRTLARLIESAREIDAAAVGNRRLHPRRVKRHHRKISRMVAKKGRRAEDLKEPYSALVHSVEGICDWAGEVAELLGRTAKDRRSTELVRSMADALKEELVHYEQLARHVVRQTRVRVLEGRTVSNEDKLFSIFEPHTELLIRGKVGKEMEFGHMVQIQQVEGCFITDYDVFARRPNEATLLPAAVASHHRLFGSAPSQLSADKGYWPGKEELAKLQKDVQMVAIAKKGKCNDRESQRERDPVFRHAQRFRAGVEGTISFLKRVLGLARCYNKGWQHYVSTAGAAVFVHNLLVLARC